jgi:hypothetical protein
VKTNFSLKQLYTPEWNGNKTLPEKDQLVAVMSMPDVQDTFEIIERLQANGVTAQDSATVGFARARAIAAQAGEYIPKYMVLEGAENFSVEDVIKYPPYFNLAVELLFELVRFAQPSEDDTKNS